MKNLKTYKEFKELDIVISTTQINDVPEGTEGTIVHDYKNGNNFIVEFFKDGKTIGVETVSKNQIRARNNERN